MQVTTGTVVSGKIILNDLAIAEGAAVYVLTQDAYEVPSLSQEELADVEAGIAEVDREEMIPGEEFFNQLRRHG